MIFRIREIFWRFVVDTRKNTDVKSRLSVTVIGNGREKSKVADLIVQHVPKQLIMALSTRLRGIKAFLRLCTKKKLDHRSTALGYDRHLNLNETIYEVFEANGCNPASCVVTVL
jgi:hypothetical protein